MNEEKIKKELLDLMEELFAESGFDTDLLEYVDLVDDLDMDSITFMSLVILVEERFGITVPDEMLLMENFKNVSDIVQIILGQMSDETKENGV